MVMINTGLMVQRKYMIFGHPLITSRSEESEVKDFVALVLKPRSVIKVKEGQIVLNYVTSFIDDPFYYVAHIYKNLNYVATLKKK